MDLKLDGASRRQILLYVEDKEYRALLNGGPSALS
jgi:hypothetical protein